MSKRFGAYSGLVYGAQKVANTASDTGIRIADVELGSGAISPIYRPEWEKVSSSLDKVNNKMTITVKGSAYKTQEINSNVSINYASDVTSTLVKEDITVFINGVEVTTTTNPTVAVSEGTTTENATTHKDEVTHTITLSNLEEATRVANVPYKEWSGNISIKIAGRGKDSSTYDEDVLVDEQGNQSMMETDENGTNADGTWIDITYTDSTMFADFLKPEFTYVDANTVIGTGDKKVKIVFDVIDKYFKESKLASTDITVSMWDANTSYDDTTLQSKIEKAIAVKTIDSETTVGNITYKTNGDIYYDIDGDGTKDRIGQRYELIISKLEQDTNDGFDFSGYMSISLPAGQYDSATDTLVVGTVDNSGNLNPATTITVGIDENDGNPGTNPDSSLGFDQGSAVVVDVVDPIWEIAEPPEGVEPVMGVIYIKVKDKYFNASDIDESDITVYTNGVVSTTITKTVTGPDEIVAGQEYLYTVRLGNITLDTAEYIDFVPTNASDLVLIDGKAQYRKENGGAVEIEIAAGCATDLSGNTNKSHRFDVGNMDATKPEVYDIQKTPNELNNSFTFIFNVTDKNYDSTDLVTADEISTWVDGIEVTSLQKELSSKEIKEGSNIVGHQYTLVLKGLKETAEAFAASGRLYKELSGSLEIRINKTAAKDSSENNLNDNDEPDNETVNETVEIKSNDIVDFIDPEVKYVYGDSSQAVAGDIDYSGKTFTMEIDVIDKYLDTAPLLENTFEYLYDFAGTATDDPVANAAAQQRVIEEYFEIKIDGETPDWTKVNKNVTVSDIEATSAFNKTIDGTIINREHIIGKKFTLVLSNLEQLQIVEGDQYADYSGVITVKIKEGTVKDTSGRGNVATTITSGVDLPGGDINTDKEVVDVVDPIWVKDTSSANAIDQTATVTIIGTDKYYASSNLTGKIKVWAHLNGATANTFTDITDSVTITPSTATAVYKTDDATKQVGDKYTITVTGFAKDVNQVKVQILADAMLDESGNGNKDTDIIVYNCLELTSSETAETSGFLGETSIARQDIHQVVFTNDISGSTADTVKKVWDASAAGDNSIIAWYSESSASYTVYIGSEDEIFANQNSSYLLAFIGYGSSATETQTVESLSLLNTTSVTDMSYMFNNFGHKKLSTLNLGNFDTKNVTDMSGMFKNCGYTAMTTLNLGSNFDTSSVTEMDDMFYGCGYKNMGTLNLGANFDTSSVTNMTEMFRECGHEKLQTLDLGESFDTSSVNYMSHMFRECGYTAMTELKLGESFDTSAVVDMQHMFNRCGYTVLANLDLGELFNTSAVTNMYGMFAYTGFTKMTSLDLGDKFYINANITDMTKMFMGCGNTLMTELDLGPHFTKIASTSTDMFTNCGKQGECVIYAPESIYSSKTMFKLSSISTTTRYYQTRDESGNITGTTHGTINPIYRPEWTKVSSALDTTNKTLAITVKGSAYIDATTAAAISSKVAIKYASNVTSTLAKEDIKVFVNGVEVTSTVNPTVAVNTGLTTVNGTSSKNEITHVITLSNLVEAARRAGIPYKELSGNIAIKIGGRGETVYPNSTNAVLKDEYGNQAMMETDQNGTNADGTWIDVKYEDTATNVNTNGTMFTDFVIPEYTYEYANTVIGTGPTGDKKVKVVFDVIDKYFKQSTIAATDITVTMNDYTQAELDAAIQKELALKTIDTETTVGNFTYKTNGDIYYDIDGDGTIETTERIGQRYELTISKLEQETNDGFKFSGYMSISLPAGEYDTATSTLTKGTIDNSGNLNAATTITIGVDEDDGNANSTAPSGGVVVDVTDPVWQVVGLDPDTGETVLRGKDKYFSSSDLDEYDITVYTNGVVSTVAGKNVEFSRYILIEEDAEGNEVVTDLEDDPTNANGVEYTLTLSNLNVDTGEYVEVVPTNADELILIDGKVKYRKDNGGAIEVEIASGTLTDKSGNVNKTQKLAAGNIDSIKPEVFDIQKTQDEANNSITFVFNVTDKNYDKTDLVEIDEIKTWLDGVQTAIDKEIVSSIEIKAELDNTVKTIGHQYTVKLTGIVETEADYRATGRKYQELSGTVEIRIDKTAAKDISSNELNEDSTTIGQFVDFIDPEVKYSYTDSAQNAPGDINYESKTFTMAIDVIDKYLKESTLENEYLAATTDAAKQTVIENYFTIKIDGETPDWTKVSKTLTITDITETFSKTVSGSFVNDEHVIGKRYTLTLSNLERLQIVEGDQYADYSGVITATLKQSSATDTTSRGNAVTTITSGVDLPGGSIGDAEVVDVVDPIWVKAKGESDVNSANAIDQTATVTIIGTDKYYASSNLTGKIKVWVHEKNAAANTFTDVTSSVTVTPSTATAVHLDNDTSKDKIGDKYTITVTGFAKDVNQVKIQILADAMLDESGNGNKDTDIIVYNCLELTSSETAETSGFLGETSIARQDIHQVVFTNDISGSTAATVKKVWDASAAGDNSIIAWYSESSAPYTVYIGSEDEIFANQNSSYLLAFIGYGSSATETETVESLSLLNTTSVTDMSYMFNNFGHKKLSTLNLGNFDTKNVTNMQRMFEGCGNKAMTTLNLGTKFNTNNVINMRAMFRKTGGSLLNTFNIGDNFYTNSVTDMAFMFNETGSNKLETLNLGEHFDTSAVTDMSYMFAYTYEVKELDLGEYNFDTTNVTNMEGMFKHFASASISVFDLGDAFDTSAVTNMICMFEGFAKNSASLTSLDLEDKFYTTSVINMSNMFKDCGTTAMTELDLGPHFTKIASTNTDFVTNTGKSGCIIYAPESIYSSKTAFKTSSTDTSTTISYTRGTINPIYRPEWTKISSALDTGNKTLAITVKGSAYIDATTAAAISSNVAIKYASNVTSTLAKEDIKVFVNGVEVTSTTNPTVAVGTGSTSTNATSNKSEITHVITLSNLVEAARRAGIPYKELSGNIAIKIGGRGETTYPDATNAVLKDEYGNQNMMETDQSGTWIDVKYEDTATNVNTNGTMFTDFVIPEYTYEYANTVIASGTSGDKKVKVVFDVIDKYFKQSTIAATDITVTMNDYTQEELDAAIQKELALKTIDTETTVGNFTYKTNGDIYYDIDGDGTIETTERIGQRYELTISKLEQTTNDGFKFSGYMSISLPAGQYDTATSTLTKGTIDNSGNLNAATTITIGIDETDGNPGQDTPGDGVVVDVVDPVWQVMGTNQDTGEVILRGKDKYFSTSDLDEDDITVYTNGVISTIAGKSVAFSRYIYISQDAEGNEVVTQVADAASANGVEYKLTLSNLNVDTGEYVEFVPTNADELILIDGKAKYRKDNGGAIEVEIASGTLTDKSANVNKVQKLSAGNMDAIKPEVFDIQKTQDEANNSITFVFNVTDKNYDKTDLVEIDEIKTWLDGVQTAIDKEMVSSKEIKAELDNTVKTVGHQYTVKLSGIVETQAEYSTSGRKYQEMSGTVELRIDKTAAKDINGNNLNEESTTIGQFVDFIDPEVRYSYTDSAQGAPGDINYESKTFTMVIDVVDKYLNTSTLENEYLAATTDAAKQTVIENYFTIKIDGETPDWSKVDKSLTITDIKDTFSKTVDGSFVTDEYVIGKKYTLVLSNLEQLQIIEGDQYADYSGVITATLKESSVTDTTSRGNAVTTITSGVDIPGGDINTDKEVVDVVDPIWVKESSSANAIDKTATVTIVGTDKYYASSSLTGKIKVWAHLNGAAANTFTDITEASGIDIEVSTATAVHIDNDTSKEKIGDKYTITVTGFAQNVNQVKIEILEDAMLDESGNGNKDTDIILYNCLELTSSETAATSGFLGETSIARQDIHQVTFTNDISGSTAATVKKVWDVSAAGDNSIIAWTSQTSAPYTVYIGSDWEIFANQNSSYLLSYVGYGESSTSETPVTGLNLLNTSSVTDMSKMFNYFGYRKLKILNLGEFDTTNVTSMWGMFSFAGDTAMTSLNLGTKFKTSNVTKMNAMFYEASSNLETLEVGNYFDTKNVTDMSYMFTALGSYALKELDLGEKFDTSSVTSMEYMFGYVGSGSSEFTELDLSKYNFDTSNVRNMNWMFEGIGQIGLTSFNLGNNFDTSSVTTMKNMFANFGKNLTALDLGDKFYTTSVTDMTKMFSGCGSTAMTTIDLGPAFTKIADTNTDFVTDTGKSGCAIFAPESIYNDRKNFKLDTDSSTTITYSRGTINPVYKPEWEHVSTSVDVANKEITITFKGYATEEFTNGTYTGNYLSTITNLITAGNDASNLLIVKVDGEVAEEITQTVTEISVTKDAENKITEVQYSIKLSGFEEETRQTDKDKNFLEWSGNIAVQPVKGTLIDIYGNKNMVAIDGSDGKWTDIEFRDATQTGSTSATVSGNWTDLEDNNADAVANSTMFTDYIKPEFTYIYSESNPDIDGDPANRVTIVFDVTDKYFESTALATDEHGTLIKVIVDSDEDVNDTITKSLTKVEDLYYTVNGVTNHKVGERYQLVIDGLESSDGTGYSGPLTLSFDAGSKDGEGNLVTGIIDKSGNLSDTKSITMGINEPDGEEGDEIVVDVVNPVWSYADSEIDRENNVVNIYILGTDKYYKESLLTKNNITVYVDGSSGGVDTDRDGVEDTMVSKITKTLTDITSEIDDTRLAELIAGAGLTDSMVEGNKLTAVGIVYKLTLSTFGNISGETKVFLPAGTLRDLYGNMSTDTTIEVGNVTWTEDGDDATNPRYPAFRNDIVDFIKPAITYTYSTVEGEENPDVDYTNKILTVKFTVTDKYLLESDLIETITNGDGSTTQIPKHMTLIIDEETIYTNDGDNTTTDTREVTATISSTDISNGKEYTLVVEGLQKYEELDNDGYTYSGPMQVVFDEGVIDDTSGNVNDTKTITLDTEYDDVVDVVDPIIKITEVNGLTLSAQNGNNRINRTDNVDTVEIIIRGEDKYLVPYGHADRELLINNAANIKVKVKKHDGTIIENSTQIQKSVVKDLDRTEYVQYKITLSDFGTDQGLTSIIIPANMIKDKSGNGNIETEVFVGNTNWALDGDGYTAFNNSIVDFTDPTWNYATSSITRDRNAETGTVTIKILGHDDYFFRDKLTLTKDVIDVYIGSELVESGLTKDLQEITDVTELTTLAEKAGLTDKIGTRTITDVVVGYTLTIDGFTEDENPVKIVIPENTIRDTSSNGNAETEFLVGNTSWVETDVETVEDGEDPKYTAFRDSIVDYIKPVITQGDVTLTETDTVEIKFTVTDTNLLESNIGTEDLTIYIDEMLVYGPGSDSTTAIEANLEITNNNLTDENNRFIGYEYTLTLSQLELDNLIGEDIFLRHSGDIKVVIAEGQVEDTSGNKSREIELTTYADFVDPIFKFHSKYTNWEDRFALVTIRGTDRFYDYDESELLDSDLTLYKQNENGDWVNITQQFYDPDNGIDYISITSVDNGYGEDFIIRLDNFTEEFILRVDIQSQAIYDETGNYNKVHNLEEGTIIVALDNRKPYWKYMSTDTDITDFEDETTTGTISFYVDGYDKYLNLTNSVLEASDIRVILDQTDVTVPENITVTLLGTDDNYTTDTTVVEGVESTVDDADGMRSVSYRIDVTGLTQAGTYTLIIDDGTLVDDYANTSAATTITCSRSTILENTQNYTMVTYHVSPDNENVHHSYIRELMSVNETGTNLENTTYRPSTLGELNSNGENPLFAEPMYNTVVNGFTVSKVYAPKSFAGWAEADSDGNVIDGGTVYGLYDEIPNTVTNLKAVWQVATVVFVSSSEGNDSNDGKLPTTPVETMTEAFNKLSSSGTADTNIIVVMDEVEWDGTSQITKAATITSLYAGVDYETQNTAALSITTDMNTTKDIKFDDIKLYNESAENVLVANYANITLGRRITTPTDEVTFGLIVGGNYGTETTTGQIGTHTVRVESGKYLAICAGSFLEGATTTSKYVTHEVVIGNMKDAALGINDKLIIGALAIGIGEQECYPYGATGDSDAYNKIYSNVTLYSGTFFGDGGDAIHTRSADGETDGIAQFTMYGGQVNGDIYAGARTTARFSSEIVNIMKFYGGKVTGNIYGQGYDETSIGSSEITLAGCINITGDIFGGGYQGEVTGNTYIIANSVSATVTGSIYGASNGGILTGTTNITVKAGTLGNIYGSGKESGSTGVSNITIENGTITGNIFGGAYNGQLTQKANILVVGGTITGNIFGGNQNTTQTQLDSDNTSQSAVITIGTVDETITTIPTINGYIYGSGQYDRMASTEINLIECANVTSVFGGSTVSFATAEARITLKGMTVNEIYGGGQNAAIVGTTYINLNSGTATEVYGGGFNGAVTNTNVILNGTATVTSIYGASNTSGYVTSSNVVLKSGTITNVFGGGNSTQVRTTNVALQGVTIDTIYGGCNDEGAVETTNVRLESGVVQTVFGGGLDTTVQTTNIYHQNGATVTSIYGGNNRGTAYGGHVSTTNIEILNSTVVNVYGGSNLGGTLGKTNINIHGNSTIKGELHGGGYMCAVGEDVDGGGTTINITQGTINNDIFGGTKEGFVYGTTNINIGRDAVDDSDFTNGPIVIRGNIYGGGFRDVDNYLYNNVIGNTHILMDNCDETPITFHNSIFGSGYGATYSTNGTSTDQSTVHLKNFGVSVDNTYELVSIERTGTLYIGNSFIEFTGRQDKNNAYKRNAYSLNRITNGLTVYDNTTIFTRRGFNMVGGFSSYKTISGYGTKATATIANGVVTKNVDNRLYTLEGVNLIFAKQEGNIYADTTLDIWGDVNGMAFFGMYAINRTTGAKNMDIYDPTDTSGAVEGFFANGTFVEGRHKANHDAEVDGFYTNIAEYGTDSVTVTPFVISPTDYGNYYDWVVGIDIVNYEVSLVASNYGKESVAELVLDYRYQPNTTYTLNRVSLNALDTDVELINPLNISTISENSNNEFGLTMETDTTGWLNESITKIYTYNNGSFYSEKGSTTYQVDETGEPGVIKFKIHNSVNITESRDLGRVNLILTAKNPRLLEGESSNIFLVVIAVNLQTEVDELDNKYEPVFTDNIETELHYTADSTVDFTYTYYNNLTETPYAEGDYRVLSTTTQLPVGTKITLKDYGQGNTANKVYYYHITADTPVTESSDGRYLYNLSNFFEMDSETLKYTDSSGYFHTYDSDEDGVDDSGYVLEKYKVSIDFGDTSIAANQLDQEIYLELRDSAGNIKYGNGESEILYNLHYNKNAIMTETISNEGNVYSVIETTLIDFTLNASIQEQETDDGERIRDTKYYDKLFGMVIEVLDASGNRVTLPDAQNVAIINVDDETEQYVADESGVIRVPILETLSSITKKWRFSIAQNSVPPGRCSVNVYFFGSDNGLHYGGEEKLTKTFYAVFVNKAAGMIGIEAPEDNRIISKATGENLAENTGVRMTISVGDATENTNIRVKLYKRVPTYTTVDEVTTYTGTTYELVDLPDYLAGTWETPENHELVSNGTNEYILWVPSGSSIDNLFTIQFNKALGENITTGEYKLVVESYYGNILVQSERKTFIVAP